MSLAGIRILWRATIWSSDPARGWEDEEEVMIGIALQLFLETASFDLVEANCVGLESGAIFMMRMGRNGCWEDWGNSLQIILLID